MDIHPTLILASSPLSEDYYNCLKEKIYTGFSNEQSVLIGKKVGMINIHPNGDVFNLKEEKLLSFDFPESNKTDVRKTYSAFVNKTRDLKDAIVSENREIRFKSDDEQLILKSLQVSKVTNILVVIDLSVNISSVFLSYLLKDILKDFKHDKYNIYINVILPDLSKVPKEQHEFLLSRIYAGFCEYESILSEKQDIINTFSVFSLQNENGDYIDSNEKVYDIISGLTFLLLKGESNIIDQANTRKHLFDRKRDKLRIYNSIGHSSVRYEKDKAKSNYLNFGIGRILSQLIEYFNSEKQDRETINNEVKIFIKNNKWDNLKEVFEEGFDLNDFQSYSSLSAADTSKPVNDQFREDIQFKKESYFNNYFRKDYLDHLNKQSKNQDAVLRTKILEKLSSILKSEYTGAVVKARAFFHSIIGKENTKLFSGSLISDPLNFRTLKQGIINKYKQFLPEDERLLPEQVSELRESIINTKDRLEELKQQKEILEDHLFGYEDQDDEEIIIEEENKVYLKIKDKRVIVGGYKPGDENDRKGLNEYKPSTNERLPAFVDMRKYMSPVEDQGAIGSCTANALVSASEYLSNRALNKLNDYSRLFVYYNGRKRDNLEMTDRGSSIGNCTRSMMDEGVCFESTWPYDRNLVNKFPSKDAYQEAKNYTIPEAEYFEVDLNTLKSSLAEGYPVVFGLKLSETFSKTGKKGIVPLPDFNKGRHSWHAMLCVGYSDTEEYFIVRNSWGQAWGDGGYCYIPYQYLANPEFCHTCYILKSATDKEKIKLNVGISSDSDSLFNYGEDLASYRAKEEEYNKLAEELKKLNLDYNIRLAELEKQNVKVLSPEFRKQVREDLINENLVNTEDTYKKLEEQDKKIKQLHDKHEQLLHYADKLKKKLFIYFPLAFLTLIAIVSFVIARQVGWPNLIGFYLLNIKYTLPATVILVSGYFIWAIIKYRRKAIIPIKNILVSIDSEKLVKSNLLNTLYGLVEQLVEIDRSYYITAKSLQFIDKSESYIRDDILDNGLEKWFAEILKINERYRIVDSRNKDISDYQQVLKEEDILELLNRQDHFSMFFHNTKQPIDSYILSEHNSFHIEEGTSSLLNDLQNYLQATEAYTFLGTINIIDLVYKTPIVLKMLETFKSRPGYIETLASLNESSIPLLMLNKVSGDEMPIHLNILHPDSQMKEEGDIINQIKTKIAGGDSEDINLFSHLSKTVSHLTFIRQRTHVSLYSIEFLIDILSWYQQYTKNKNVNKKLLFINDEFEQESYIPDELKNQV